MMDDWNLHDLESDESLESDILDDQLAELASMLRCSLPIAPPVIERGCWVMYDGRPRVVVWVRPNGMVLLRTHKRRVTDPQHWVLSVAPLDSLSYLRPEDETSAYVVTLQGRDGVRDGPVELTWEEVQAGMDRAAERVARWPDWKRDLG